MRVSMDKYEVKQIGDIVRNEPMHHKGHRLYGCVGEITRWQTVVPI